MGPVGEWGLGDTFMYLGCIFWRPKGMRAVRRVTFLTNLYRVTRHLDSYVLLKSIWGVPLACLGSS